MELLSSIRRRTGLSLLALCLCLILLQSAFGASSSPQRIVSLGPMNTKNIYLLGAGDRLVANTVYCRLPAAAREKEKIGTVLQIDIEHILSLRPDLVLATGLTQPQQIDALRRAGMRVVQFKEPRSFIEIRSQFLALGRLLGLEERAAAILAEVEVELRAISTSTAGLPQQRVLLQIGTNPIFAATASSFTHDFISMAGGINIAALEKSGRYNQEKVLAQNPDVIIIAMMGSQTGVGAAEKRKWQDLFAGFSSAGSRGIFLIDPDLVCSPTPVSFLEALTVVSRLIHPELAGRALLSARE